MSNVSFTFSYGIGGQDELSIYFVCFLLNLPVKIDTETYFSNFKPCLSVYEFLNWNVSAVILSYHGNIPPINKRLAKPIHGRLSSKFLCLLLSSCQGEMQPRIIHY